MKKTIVLIMALVLCFLLTACGGDEAPAVTPEPAASETPTPVQEAEPLEIEIAIPGDISAVESEGVNAWMALVESSSGGSIRIRRADESQQTHEALLEDAGGGARNMILVSTSALSTRIPGVAALRLPYLFESYGQAAAYFGGEAGYLPWDRLDAQNGVRALNTFFGGFRYVFSEPKLTEPEDCFGILIRSPREDVFTDMLGLMGFSYIAMEVADGYDAMSDGVITAVEGTLFELCDRNYHELGSNVLCTRHLLEMSHIVVNDAWWTGLTEQQRALLQETLAEAAAEQRDLCWMEEKLAQNALGEEGVSFHELSKSAQKELREMFAEYCLVSLQGFEGDIRDIPDDIRDLA